MIDRVSKVLSPNDVGRTGGHQAGILVPKMPEVLGYFPFLSSQEKNPRASISFWDDGGDRWDFMLIYYNNRQFGGTRNEYRLTGMTKFFRAHNAKPKDEVVFGGEEGMGRRIALKKRSSEHLNQDVVKLSGGWKVISAKPL